MKIDPSMRETGLVRLWTRCGVHSVALELVAILLMPGCGEPPSAEDEPAAGGRAIAGAERTVPDNDQTAPSRPPTADTVPAANEPLMIGKTESPVPAPEGMVWIPGGEFWMGTDDPMMSDARPIHRVVVDGFWMDRTEVTNRQFEKFVEATGYLTVAERKPDPRDYPGADPALLVPGSIVFSPPDHEVRLDNAYQWWKWQPGANWRHPEGPEQHD